MKKNSPELYVESVCEGFQGPCSDGPAFPAGVRTMYPDQEQPNPVLCVGCAYEWHAHWDDMWSNVETCHPFITPSVADFSADWHKRHGLPQTKP